MKVLRVLRRRKIKLSFVCLLLLIFVFNTYAWMSRENKVALRDMSITVNDWGVEFVIDDEEITTQEYTFDIEEFHPGINVIEKKLYVYNVGDANSLLTYEIADIYLYGEQIIKTGAEGESQIPETVGAETTNLDGNTTANLFGNADATIFDENNTNYSFYLRNPTPFLISYTHEKTHISGKSKNEVGTSWMTINLAWFNNESNNEEDTKLGNMVYDFEHATDAEGNLINEGEPAIRIVVRVTARRELTSDNTYAN